MNMCGTVYVLRKTDMSCRRSSSVGVTVAMAIWLSLTSIALEESNYAL